MSNLSSRVTSFVAVAGLLGGMTGWSHAAISYLSIDGSAYLPDFGRHLWRIEYDPTVDAPDTFEVMQAIFGVPVASGISGGNPVFQLGDDHDSIRLVNYGTDASPNYLIQSITLGGKTLSNGDFITDFNYWNHWVEGGEAGWPVAGADSTPDSWDEGAGITRPYRLLTDGSFDALTYGGWMEHLPSTLPSDLDFSSAPLIQLSGSVVPEPSRFLLLVPALLLGCTTRHRSLRQLQA